MAKQQYWRVGPLGIGWGNSPVSPTAWLRFFVNFVRLDITISFDWWKKRAGN